MSHFFLENQSIWFQSAGLVWNNARTNFPPYLKDMLSRRKLIEASGNRIFLFGFSSEIATNIDGYGFCTGIGVRKW
jgi:hypothetical protein